jgi:translocator protein
MAAFAQERPIKFMEAALLASTAVLGAALVARRWGPEPAHPQTATWYAALRKPPFTPPGAAIAGVWAGLDVLLAAAGTRLLAAPPSPARSGALGCCAVAVAGIPGWMRVFFGGRHIIGGLGVIVAMLAATMVGIGFACNADRPAAAALLPLAGWLGFAGALNGEIWRRNG